VGVVGGQPVITFGATAAENLLTAHPEIKVILAYNDAQGLGALQTVTANAAINADQFAIYGSDGTPDGVAAITSGSPFRGSVRIGGPNPLHLDTYRYARLILSGSPYPAEMLDNLTALTIDNAQ
jgi:ABC-type sugar transport system substrate-binding protein